MSLLNLSDKYGSDVTDIAVGIQNVIYYKIGYKECKRGLRITCKKCKYEIELQIDCFL